MNRASYAVETVGARQGPKYQKKAVIVTAETELPLTATSGKSLFNLRKIFCRDDVPQHSQFPLENQSN